MSAAQSGTTPADPKTLPGKRTILVILDGFGISENKENNAVYLADTPRLDGFFAEYPHTLLAASGPEVGLPPGQIGNSEVGHVTLGCGCVIEQDIIRINKAIDDGSFFTNTAFLSVMEEVKHNRRPLHLLGLVSDGGVHSHVDHLKALIEMCRRNEVVPLLHAMTDGRDTLPMKAHHFVEGVEAELKAAGGAIVSIFGRYYGMDRDHRWARTEKAWRAIMLAEGKPAKDATAAILKAHLENVGDEFIDPVVLPGARPLDEKDRFIFFNFRNDRPRQLLYALVAPQFDGFERGIAPLVQVVTMTEVHKRLPCRIAFAPVRPMTTLSREISRAGYRQFHCAETEKYPHITFYFNGGVESPLPGEERRLVPSPKVATYDLCPEMSANKVADEVIAALQDPGYAFIVTNFANTDMVGHTAVASPVIKAVEVVDRELGRVVDTALKNDWLVLVTSDHGNCDEMLDAETRQPNTQHTLNPVPCLLIGKRDCKLAEGCNVSGIAPTVLDLMGLEIPQAMKSPSMLLKDTVAGHAE